MGLALVDEGLVGQLKESLIPSQLDGNAYYRIRFSARVRPSQLKEGLISIISV